MKRKCVMLSGVGQVHVGLEEIPAVAENEILVEVHAALISSGTEMGDVMHFRNEPTPHAKPISFGYSNAGVILKCGSNCKRLKESMRVACMGPRALHADYVIVPQNLAIEIPDSVSYEEATFAHLGATSLHAVRRAELELGENVLVAGLGIVGNLAGQLAKMCGCHVVGTDLHQLRRDVALATGFDKVVDPVAQDMRAEVMDFTRGRGLDAALLCMSGEATDVFKSIHKVMKQAPDTHRYGRIVIPGGLTISTMFAAAIGNVDLRSSARTGPGYFDKAYESGSDYPDVFVKWPTQRNLEEVIRAISEKRIDVRLLIRHRFPLEQASEACELLIRHPEQTVAVMLQPRGAE